MTWIRYQQILITRTLMNWVQASEYLMLIYHVFQECILLPIHQSLFPVKPLFLRSIQSLTVESIFRLQEYIVREILPVKSQIAQKLQNAHTFTPSDQKKIYEETLHLHHYVQPCMIEAKKWLRKHPELATNSTFQAASLELRKTATLLNQIAALNPEVPFLCHRPGSPLIPKRIPIGLINENGSDCFMNVVRQLLFNIPALRRHLLEKLPPDRYKNTLANAATYILAQQRRDYTSLGGSRIIRDDVDMQTGQQEDASEALTKFLNHVGDLKKINPNLPLSPNNVEQHNPLLFWITHRKRFQINHAYADFTPDSRAGITPDGWIRSQYIPASTLTLDLKDTANISLEKALERWADCNSGGDAYLVTKANGEKVECPLLHEESRFNMLPPYLILTLKRFERGPGYNIKDNRILDMHETFVINGNIVQTRENGFYRVKGFVSHQGKSAYVGHYISYIFIPDEEKGEKGTWYCCDDRFVSKVDLPTVREALSTCYFIYSELEEKISDQKAKTILDMREHQTQARELQLAARQSMKSAKANNLKKQIDALEYDLDMLAFFKAGAIVKNGDPNILSVLFSNTPREFQSLCVKLLQIEKGYSNSEAVLHLHELTAIIHPYLIQEQGDTRVRHIIDQYIYIKQQKLFFLKNAGRIREQILLQLEQLLALQSILERRAISAKLICLILNYLPDRIQKTLAPLTRKINQPLILKKVQELIITTQSSYFASHEITVHA